MTKGGPENGRKERDTAPCLTVVGIAENVRQERIGDDAGFETTSRRCRTASPGRTLVLHRPPNCCIVPSNTEG